MGVHDQQFWTEPNKYQELAKQYEQNIEITHPRSGADCFCSAHCPFAATRIKYYTYTGEALP